MKAGVDCCKYGKQWVITTKAMYREYGKPRNRYTETTDADDFSWDNLMAAEKEPPYKK